MNARIDYLKEHGFRIDSVDDTLPGVRCVKLSKVEKVTSRDPFGNAEGEGERLVQKEILIYSDGTYEETTH